MTFGLSEHNTEGCDCAAHKKYRSLEIHEEHCSDNNCVLESCRLITAISHKWEL